MVNQNMLLNMYENGSLRGKKRFAITLKFPKQIETEFAPSVRNFFWFTILNVPWTEEADPNKSDYPDPNHRFRS